MREGGHYPIFPEGKKYIIYPRKFVLRHYSFRSKKQAEKKMKDRIDKSIGEKSKEGLTQHLKNALNNRFAESVDHTLLTKYNENNRWNLERKYVPFVVEHPKKSDIFSEDGSLKFKPKSIQELREVLKKKKKKIVEQKELLIKLKMKITELKKQLNKT